MTTIHTRSRVGPDGKIVIPVGVEEAGAEVIVTVIPAPTAARTTEEWSSFIGRTAGKWEGNFERPSQGDPEQRDTLD